MEREDLIYKELGGGLLEKHYQKAVAIALKLAGVKYIEQFPIILNFNGQFVGKYAADFLIEIGDAKIILEIKKHENFGEKNIQQVNNYLKATGFKLGILANFTTTGVKYKRIVNLN